VPTPAPYVPPPPAPYVPPPPPPAPSGCAKKGVSLSSAWIQIGVESNGEGDTPTEAQPIFPPKAELAGAPKMERARTMGSMPLPTRDNRKRWKSCMQDYLSYREATNKKDPATGVAASSEQLNKITEALQRLEATANERWTEQQRAQRDMLVQLDGFRAALQQSGSTATIGQQATREAPTRSPRVFAPDQRPNGHAHVERVQSPPPHVTDAQLSALFGKPVVASPMNESEASFTA